MDESTRTPLPCLICGFQPEPAVTIAGGTRQPSDAVMFTAGNGNYGSTVWDEMNPYRSMEINICDKCLVEHKDRVAIAEAVRVERPEPEFVPWDPEEE